MNHDSGLRPKRDVHASGRPLSTGGLLANNVTFDSYLVLANNLEVGNGMKGHVVRDGEGFGMDLPGNKLHVRAAGRLSRRIGRPLGLRNPRETCQPQRRQQRRDERQPKR
ncbi:MAG: hypothetical protein ACE5F9_01030 [Phycisphaerae bacterium]